MVLKMIYKNILYFIIQIYLKTKNKFINLHFTYFKKLKNIILNAINRHGKEIAITQGTNQQRMTNPKQIGREDRE